MAETDAAADLAAIATVVVGEVRAVGEALAVRAVGEVLAVRAARAAQVDRAAAMERRAAEAASSAETARVTEKGARPVARRRAAERAGR